MKERAAPRLELEIENLEASLHVGAARLRAFCEALELSEAVIYRASLVFEELVTNALKYGRLVAGGGVRVTATVEPKSLKLLVRDHGRAFDPSVPRRRKSPRTLEQAPRGGLGLRLVKSATSSLVYRRDKGENVVEARVTLGSR